MTGLNISDFLRHTSDSGSRANWLRQWRKNQVGECTIWLHTQAPIIASYNHTFMLEDEVKDKETGKTKDILRYVRFNSPDPALVHSQQFFRDDGELRVLPDRDPFLILREWLRRADHIGLEDVIFHWTDHKNRGASIDWDRGALSGLVKRGRANFNYSLDTKLEYCYVVVDHDEVSKGCVLAREGKLLAAKMAEVIRQQQTQHGVDEGDPKQFPYAFQWVAKNAPSPMDTYNSYKNERAKLTDEIEALITGEEYPDPVPHGEPGDGDLEKIREMFIKAQQIDLPLDEIFSEDPEVRRGLIQGKRKRGGAAPVKSQAQRQAEKEAAKPVTRQRVPAPVRDEPPTAAAPAADTAAAGRRKKVDKPKDPPPVETIPCDDCGKPMLPTAAKCESCGAEYEVEEATPPPAAAAPKGINGKPAQAKPPPPAAAKDATCWSCGADLDADGACGACGIDQGDDVPF